MLDTLSRDEAEALCERLFHFAANDTLNLETQANWRRKINTLRDMALRSLAERADRVSKGMVEVSRTQLQHWAEYWSGNRNDTAMHDALEHIINEVESVLAALARGEQVSEEGDSNAT